MDFKALARDIIKAHGQEDVEWMTISETVRAQNDQLELGLSGEELEDHCDKLFNTIKSAVVTISWNDNES